MAPLRLAATLGAALLVACAAAGEERPAPGPLPEGAVPVGEGLYMVPAGRDEGGCEIFTPYAPEGAAIQVIHYRKRGGGFTVAREEADCG